MTTIDDILNAARLNAATPADVMRIEDLQREHQALADTMLAHGYDADDVATAMDDLKALRDHASKQPFDRASHLLSEDVNEWLAELERLAE